MNARHGRRVDGALTSWAADMLPTGRATRWGRAPEVPRFRAMPGDSPRPWGGGVQVRRAGARFTATTLSAEASTAGTAAAHDSRLRRRAVDAA